VQSEGSEVFHSGPSSHIGPSIAAEGTAPKRVLQTTADRRDSMRRQASMSRWPGRGVVLACVLLLAGCGYAKRKDVDAQFSQLRAEMQQADQSQAAQIEANSRRIGELERALESLRSDFNVRIERLQGEFEGMIAFDVPVHFEFDDAMIRQQDQAVLDKFASVAQKYYGGSLITVEGFTDPAGSASYNQQLGMKRAESVKTYLISHGLTETAVRTVSYGETRNRLIDPNATHDEPGAAQNRRVTFVMDTRTMAGTTISSR
jgi:outer membrane protein OmpA-like peptidoglycan-associated protein